MEAVGSAIKMEKCYRKYLRKLYCGVRWGSPACLKCIAYVGTYSTAQLVP